MPDKNIPLCNFFRLPFKPGTRILTEFTLNKYSEIREPRKDHLSIKTRKIAFRNELLVIGVTLDSEPEEMVYIKATTSELLVSCSVDTHEDHLSRYAYFTLRQLMQYYCRYDFEDYYWPGFFDPATGACKYLITRKSKDNLRVSLKANYKGLYKPGQHLPTVSANVVERRAVTPQIPEQPPKNSQMVLGFCLANCNDERYRTNHYPFLIPYLGILNKAKTELRSFTTYVLNEMQLSGVELTEEQYKLVELCFEMKKIAMVDSPQHDADVHSIIEIQKQNQNNFTQLFKLWQRALPLLSGRLYTHYTYTFGMRNVKGKPERSSMIHCTFDHQTAEICFLWRDKGDYYQLELRLILDGKIHRLQYFNTAFFAMLSYKPRKYVLLNAVADSELVTYFQQSHYQLLVLKKHYEGDFKDFVDQLRRIYSFINK